MIPVRIQFSGGLNSVEMLREVLWVVADVFEFIEDNERPDFVLFGPYGPLPEPGSYVRIGYYCENIWPNLHACEWAFGIPYDEEVGSDRYCRIEWHGIRPEALVKDVSAALAQPIPARFCNFVFSNPVGFREHFFRVLCRYKSVDAPGRSMHNCPSFDDDFSDENRWIRKRKFLAQYKFTVAFENSSTLGYNTEKLTDPMLAGSIPIYFGNPEIARHFNPRSFINAHDYLPSHRHGLTRWIERLSRHEYGRPDWVPFRMQPRARKAMRIAKHRLEYGFDFSKLVARIAKVDQDDNLYRAMMAEPWVPANAPQSTERMRKQWMRIFESSL